MAFNLVEYGKLKSSLIESIRTEIKSFDEKKDTSPEKLFESAQCLSTVRRIQAQRILVSIAILDTYPDSDNDACIEKARILNTLAFCTHEEIVDSYKGTWLSADRSDFKRTLSSSLDLKVGNIPGLTDLHDMFPSLIKFFKDNLYTGGDVRRGYLPEQKFVIEGFSPKAYIDELNAKNLDNYQKLADKAELKNQQLQAPQSLLGWFSGSSSSSAPVKDQKTKSTVKDTSESVIATGLK